LISCSSDLDKLERTYSMQFYTDVSNVIIPDTISQKQIFRFKPKTTSEQYAIAIYLPSGGDELITAMKEVDVKISDYEGNTIHGESRIYIESMRRGTSNGTGLSMFYGSYALSSDQHYRIEISIPEFDLSIIQDSLSIHVGIIEHEL